MSGPADAIPLRRAPTDLAALLKGTIETLQQQARAIDIALTVDSGPGLPLLSIDGEKIAWAVATLVGNAFRYVRRGTRRHPGGSIQVRIRADGSWVTVAVEDDGPGIPPEKAANLFRRGHGVTHGTGLALMLIEDVVTAHGGAIDVKSKCDPFASGTVVTLRLPAASTAGAVPPA